ncbi:UxaA family hydrolase [Carboxylicivirga linearis]|uniref:Altronate dehydratase n=1 Tax=Carboxylicivirga linearis TaxID=1628157 RepID=A0ABS5JVR8_9BACT|nr:altronate dehydratase family protein [Carboxylicivirga linearis]MBS2098426.1 altronate dehydratase [Carboxylicivirga linearis]
MKSCIKIHPEDSVVVALEPISKGDKIVADGFEINVNDDVPQGHKIAIKPIKKGEHILKYAASIGIAQADVNVGDHIHVQNLRTGLGDNLSYCYNPNGKAIDLPDEGLTFDGYLRTNGEVGIRNELWIVPTVGCVNGQARLIANQLKQEADLSNIDDVVVMGHQYGCSQLGDDHNNTQRALAQLIKHPNAGGVLVLGLGCENNQISSLKEVMGDYDQNRIQFLVSQDVEDEVEVGLEIVKELAKVMKQDKRSAQPVSKLRIGLKCGGSDGFSGITANPLLGRFSDWLVGQGGTTVLTEVPEMFGAETLLMDRADTEKVFDKTVSMINGFKDYFRSHDQPIYENPSPGNKNGGITTLEEKSLGCVQKGGTAIVNDVLNYADPIVKNGLNLLWSPGNDLVAASALGFSGCQMVLFTTGRGTPFGSFVPTVKVATNTQLFRHKSKWMDFNAGVLVEGADMDEVRKKFTQYLIDVASGKRLHHEMTDFKEIAIFKSGVTL